MSTEQSQKNIDVSRGLLNEMAKIAKGDFSYVDRHFSKDHVWHDPAAPQLARGVEGAKQFLHTYAQAFPDLHFTPHEIFATDDKVVSRWLAEGTHTGSLDGSPPTGRSTRVEGMTIDRYDAQGKLVETWNIWDTLSLFVQLGLVSPPGDEPRRSGESEQAQRA
jgi:steroid delta-isomerase-like uncharacterized protein